MSVDNYRSEYHLTTNGWINGSDWFYNKIQGEAISRPEDTIETWERHETQSSAYSRPEVSWSCIWRKSGIEAAEIKRLHAKFPRDLES